jgi:hypothetical protein
VPRDGNLQAVNNSFPYSRSASGSIYPNSSTSHSDVSHPQNCLADVLGTVRQECFQPFHSYSTGNLDVMDVSSYSLEIIALWA